MVIGHEDISGLTVPADDGSIAAAMERLDTRLAEWSTAMRAAHESLARQSATCRPPRAGESENDPRQESPPPVAQATADAAMSRRPEPDDRPVPADSQWTPEQLSEKLAACARQPAAPIQQATAPPPDEEEALLASLDPETAKAIRVMRRLGMEERSVRELLEEYESTKQKGKDKRPQKRSFFSRGW